MGPNFSKNLVPPKKEYGKSFSSEKFRKKFRKKHSDASGARALFGGTGRAFSLEVGSFALTYKFSETPEALRTHLFARPGSLGLDFGSRGRSWPRFWKAK